MEQGTRSKWGINFKPDLTLGNVIALTTIICSAFGSYYGIKNAIETSAADRAELHRQINDIQVDRKETKGAILKRLDDNHDMDLAQNSRIDAYSDRVKQLLDIAIEHGKQLDATAKEFAKMHEDFAVMKYALQAQGYKLPSEVSGHEGNGR